MRKGRAMLTKCSQKFQMQPSYRGCPDYDACKQLCLAANGRIVPGRRQKMTYCATDDYDNCPIYLGKALRSSRSQGLDRQTRCD
jgi:hypothetical protein